MSNAAKYKKKAAELELQKQFDKAVAMYVRAIEAGDAEGAEVDVTVLNKVGDLTLRLGRVGEAVTSYERAVEHYTTVGLFNNAIALCNKILRHAPGRAGIYLTLGRVCAKKGMRGDATRNFLEYASRMKQEGRTDEAMRSLAEVAGLMPELDEVRRLVEEHAERVGIALPAAAAAEDTGPDLAARRDSLVFLDIDYDAPVAPTPPLGTMPIAGLPTSGPTAIPPVAAPLTNSLDDLLIFDPLSDDALPEEPVPLEDLEALPDDAVGSDVPSLLTPTEPVAVDPSLAAADGLTDALGFDVDDVPSEAPLPLDGLVSDADDAALIAPLDVEPLPVVDDVDSLPIVDDVEPLPDVDNVDSLPMVDDVEPLPVVDDVDSTPVLDDAELPLAVEPPAHVEAVESSTSLDPTEAPTNAESLPPVELPTLTPYRGVEAITPPANELDTLSPYDGVASIAPPDDETVAPVALDTLSPYDGVASVPPPSETPTPPLAPEIVAPESVAALDEVETIAELATEQVAPAEVGDDREPTRPLDETEPVDEAVAASADVAAIIEVPEPIEILDVIDTMDFVDVPEPLELLDVPDASERSDVPEPLELLDVPDASEPLDVTEVFERVDVVDAMDFVDVPDPIEIMDVAEAVELLDVSEAGEIADVAEAVELLDVTEAVESVDVVGAIDRDDRRDAIEIIDATEALATEEVIDSLAMADRSDAEVPATLDALELSVSANDDDVQFAALLVNAPLPPAHSTRPARAIPRLDPHDFILPGELPPIVLPTSWLDISPLSARPSDEVADTDESDTTVSGSVEVDTLDADVTASAASETLSDEVTDELVPAPIDADRGVSTSVEDASTPPDGLEGLDDLDHLDDFDHVDELDHLDELDAAFTPSASSAAFNLALDRCERLRDEVDANPGDWARRRRLAEALLEAGERASGLDELAATALGLELEGALPDAVRVLDDLVRVAPDQVAYHQKRVELAVRLGDRDRLRESYLDLADALVRSGNAVRAEPVYVRVLELDPWDDRARAALGDAAPPPPSPKPSASPADDGYVNLADWLADDAAPRDTRMRVKEPTVTGDEDADFDALLRNFREGVARSLGEDDYESHYDLGVAYKEMGLLDDAVAEFQRALRSPTHRLPAYEALGQCFLEQGSFPVAVTVLSRALHEPGLDDEQRVGVLYLLGYACEALQRRDEARSYYQRVYATDIHFRDVAERLTALDGGAQ